MRARARVCVVSVIVKRPVLPPCAVYGRCRNSLYDYDYVTETRSEFSLSNIFFFFKQLLIRAI